MYTSAGDFVLSGELYMLDDKGGRVAVLVHPIPASDCYSRMIKLEAFAFDPEAVHRICNRIFAFDGVATIDPAADLFSATISLPGSITDDEVYLEMPVSDLTLDREYQWHYVSEDRPWVCGRVDWIAASCCIEK
jgi:hypothetical protein